MRSRTASPRLLGLGALLVLAGAVSLGTSRLGPLALADGATHLGPADGHLAFVGAVEPRGAASVGTLTGVAGAALLVAVTWIIGLTLIEAAGPRGEARRARWWARLVGAPPVPTRQL